MDILAASLDVVKLLVVLGLFVYALALFRTFRGGIMGRGFSLLMVAPIFFALTEALNALHNFGIQIYDEKLLADSFELLFVFALFAGFYLLAAAWKTERSDS